MCQFGKDSYFISSKWFRGLRLLLIGLVCSALSACAHAPLAIYESSQQGQESMAILELQDGAMFFEEVLGKQISGEQIHRMDFPMTVRSLKVMPGTYQLSLIFEHLVQPKCWQEGGTERCWAVRDRGWWLPGATLIPGTVEWSAKAGKTYVVTRVEDYWSIPEKASWNPTLSLAKVK